MPVQLSSTATGVVERRPATEDTPIRRQQQPVKKLGVSEEVILAHVNAQRSREGSLPLQRLPRTPEEAFERPATTADERIRPDELQRGGGVLRIDGKPKLNSNDAAELQRVLRIDEERRPSDSRGTQRQQPVTKMRASEMALLAQVNEQRSREGLPPLQRLLPLKRPATVVTTTTQPIPDDSKKRRICLDDLRRRDGRIAAPPTTNGGTDAKIVVVGTPPPPPPPVAIVKDVGLIVANTAVGGTNANIVDRRYANTATGNSNDNTTTHRYRDGRLYD